jgi:multimeric flavodoxin WrbA
MARIGVVRHSSQGYTRLLAESVARGAAESGVVDVIRDDVIAEDITAGRYEKDCLLSPFDSCDALIFGCPTFMGSVSARMKAFMDACLSRWYERTWSGKVGAAFTTSATLSGDKLNTLPDLFVFATQMGMIWVGNDEAPVGRSGSGAAGENL